MGGRLEVVMSAIALLVLAGCGQPTATPDLVATEVAVHKAAMATLTTEAPTATPTVTPTCTPTTTPVPEVPDENGQYYSCLFGTVSEEQDTLQRAMSDMSYENACANIVSWKQKVEGIRDIHRECAVPTNQHLLNARGYIDSALGRQFSCMVRMELNCVVYDARLLNEANDLLSEADELGQLANAELESYYRERIAEEVAAEIEAEEEAYWDWPTEEAEKTLDDYYREKYEGERHDYEQSLLDGWYEDWYYEQSEP